MKYEVDATDETVVTLDTYNSDLNLVIDGSKYSAQPLTKEGFAFMWAGARASHGAAKGKFCFELKVIEQLDVSHLPADEPNPHVVRVGFSVDSSTMQLGEDPLSYGYGGTGKISTNCQFKDFGPPFMAGDCVLAVANMQSDPIQIGFAKNGNFVGWAYKIKKSELQEKALFPHVLTKNCSFEVNFGQREEPYFKLPDAVKDYIFIGCLPIENRVGGTRPPEKREDCEMIMMCGLPGAGKSVWAAEFSKKHPDKKYNVIGTNNIIDKMKVMGLPRKRNYHGRWDVLIQMATKCLNSMFAIGSKLRRNFILDQTNVYPTAQRRKMRNFDGFKRKAIVVVPSDTEYRRRCDKRDREEGKEIPDSAVLEMKAHFKIPEVSDIFDDVIFTELQRDEAEKLVQGYNEEGKASIGPARKQFRPNESDNKGFDSRKRNFGYNKNDMSDSRGNRGNFGNFQGDQGMRGPNAFGGYGGGRGNFNNRGGFNGGRGGGYDSGFGGRDYNAGRGGYSSSGSYGDKSSYDYQGSGRVGFEGSYGGGQSSYDNSRNIGRGNFDDSRGGRGGYDGNHGGGRGSFDGNRRGGFDDNRRGGIDENRGSGRGRMDDNRGGGRGGFDDNRGGGRGGFDDNSGGSRGGFDSNRGGGRGGFDSNRGRGGYNGNRGGGRGGYDGNRSGGRGGYDGNRGGGRGGFDVRGSIDSYGSARGDSYDNRTDTYSMYGTSGRDGASSSYSSGYGSDRGYDKTNRSEQSGEKYRSDYGMTDSIPSGTRRGFSDYSSESYPTDKFSDQGYGNNLSSDYKRGSSNTTFQQGNRGAASRGGFQNESYSRDNEYSSSYSGANTNVRSGYSGANTNVRSSYSGANANTQSSYSGANANIQSSYSGANTKVQSSYSERSYGYGSGSGSGSLGYGDYKSQTADTYGSRDTQQTSYTGSANIKSEPTQRFSGSNLDTGSKYKQGTGYSGATRQTRWSAEIPQTAATSADTFSSTRSQGYAYPKSDTSATGYQEKQTYGYQPASGTNTASQQWMASNVTSASTTANYGASTTANYGASATANYGASATANYGTGQAQWMQYSQQMPNQYYSQ